MSRRGALPAAAAALALALAPAPAPAAPAAEGPLRATILFTGDVAGYTEPCG